MEYLIQLIIKGIIAGGLYALLALGFVLIMKSTQIFNFAQGTLFMLGAYMGWWFSTGLGLPMWLTFILVIIFCVALGFFLERVCLRPMIGQSHLSIVMLTIALSFTINGIVLVAFPQQYNASYRQWLPQESLMLGKLPISYEHVIIFLAAMCLFLVFMWFFHRTKIGLAMRGTGEEHQIAQVMGIDVRNIFAYSWIIAIITASMAGIFIGTMVGISFDMSAIGLMVFPVIILGGLESVGGVVVGGIIIGLLEYLGRGYLDPVIGTGFSNVFPYLVMLVILLIKPYGLFGLTRIERV